MSADYRPLEEVREDLRVEWYRSPLPPGRLKELSRRSDVQGMLQAGGHLVLFLCTGWLVYHFWSVNNWAAFAATLFAHGTLGSFLSGVAPHECGHGTVFRTRWLNKAFTYVFSLLSWWDPYDYASSHTYHHRYTQYVEGDRENVHPLVPSLSPILLIQLFTINLFSGPGRNFGKGGFFSTVFITIKSALGIVGSTENVSREWIQTLHDDQPNELRRSLWWSRLQLLFHGSVIAYSAWSGLWVLAFIISFFPFTASWLAYFVGTTQHCGLRGDIADFRKNTRSIRLNPIASFLYWRMNWHTEHHMYAGVPCYNLRKLAQEIADDMPEPKNTIGAWKEMRMIWRKQQDNPTYQYDVPLPETATEIRSDTPDSELEGSIGELAPEGLR
jgi:fatty acid desaturase